MFAFFLKSTITNLRTFGELLSGAGALHKARAWNKEVSKSTARMENVLPASRKRPRSWRPPLGVLVGLSSLASVGEAMRTARPWTEKHWCESIVEPEWPMAYQKYAEQSVESKGRVNSNLQDMRHECATYGGESKCHICEEIENGTINYQLQGVAWEEMAHNIPTVTDSPFAVSLHKALVGCPLAPLLRVSSRRALLQVGGTHRFDFGSPSTSHVCVIISGNECMRPALNSTFFPPPPPSHPVPNDGRPSDTVGVDYSNCTVLLVLTAELLR